MSLAKEINNKLDEILAFNKTLNELKEDYDEIAPTGMEDIETGEKLSQEEVFNKAEEIRLQIIEDLNKITNNGNNIRDIFTNEYYVNDMIQDKEIAEENKENKLNDELRKQNGSNN